MCLHANQLSYDYRSITTMFYIYEGSVDPDKEILRGLVGLVRWFSRRILCMSPPSLALRLFLSFILYIYFPIVRRFPLNETRATVF